MIYKDLKGLKIRPEVIDALLERTGKTEQEVIDFLGKKRVEKNGFVGDFLDMFARNEKYHFDS